VSEVDALTGRVRTLRAEATEADRYAEACRAAATRLHGPLAALGDSPVNLGGMRSRSAVVSSAQARADAASGTVHAVRGALSGVVDDLGMIARKYERQADAARADLLVALRRLAATQADKGW
jgi:hypothetical protein